MDITADRLTEALLIFAAMVMVIWVLPSIVHRQGHPREDRDLTSPRAGMRLHS